ncbi:MAG: DinB family protein [Hyphomicrobiaceae bacterium]
MISVEHVRTMARYNQWQNQSLYGAADGLSDAERLKDRAAFFESIHCTLSHILWGDQQWMSRFAPERVEKPPLLVRSGGGNYPDWSDLKARRVAFDQVIIDWADAMEPGWLDGDLTWYSGILKADQSKPRWFLVTHFFNHQTHHRGQVHAMLTAAGAKPDDTDLMLMETGS